MYTIYTRPDCPWCDRAKVLLSEYKKDYEEINIYKDPWDREKFIKFISAYLDKDARPTVPQVFDGDRYIGGFESLSEHLTRRPFR